MGVGVVALITINTAHALSVLQLNTKAHPNVPDHTLVLDSHSLELQVGSGLLDS